MEKLCQVAAFEVGELRVLSEGSDGRECVLGLPLSRLVAKMVRVPNENREDPVAFAKPVLEALSPFPDDPLAVSCETVGDDAGGLVVLAAALPEGAADDIAEALDQKKLSVVRVDALALGELRGLWDKISTGGRKLVLLDGKECLTLIVLDDDRPSAIRALTDRGDLKREVMLSLLEAEDFGGAKELREIVIVEKGGGVPAEGLETFAPVRQIVCGDEDLALVGVRERSGDPGSLDVLPESWRVVLGETRFKAKLTKGLIAAGAVWLLAMGVLFGGPLVYGHLEQKQKDMCRRHQSRYREVRDMKARVVLVRKYSDHARGALEIMQRMSDLIPEDVTLRTWNFKREDGVIVSGTAASAEAVYAFKTAMEGVRFEPAEGEEGEGEAVFPTVLLDGPNGREFGFKLDCRYQKEDES